VKTDASSVLVDSNVIIDIVGQDPVWMDWSVEALSTFVSAFVNPLVFAELCYVNSSHSKVEKLLGSLDLGYQELPKDALFLAAHAYKLYRLRGGRKTAPLPDFFIGAHAAALGVPILTRDVSRYKAYFPKVTLISPDIGTQRGA
jgi:predicted nucleic acid-binding protein